MLVAIDFGITNTDVVINEAEKNKFYTFPTKKINEDFIGIYFIFIFGMNSHC